MGSALSRLPRSPLAGYAIAVFTPTLAFWLTLGMGSVMAHNPFLLFVAAVVVSAWYGGLGPGILSCMVSTLACAYILWDPDRSSQAAIAEISARLGVFLFVAFLINTAFDMRRRAEVALQRREREEQIIFDSVPAMIWYKDKDNRILRANKAAADSMGLRVEELEGKSTHDLYPEEANRYYQDDLKVIKTGQPKRGIVEPYRNAAGEKRWLRTDKIPYRDDKGEIIGVIVFAVDITEQVLADEALQNAHAGLERLVQERTQSLAQANAALRAQVQERLQAEAALRESESRLRALIEAIPQQVWTAKPDGALDYVSQRVVEYFGRTFEDMIGWGWEQVLHPDDLPECRKRWLHALETGEPYEIEFRLKNARDGSYRWHLGRALPLRGPNGLIVKWFGTNTDITERKQIENALQRAYAELEWRVRERTAELALSQEQLRALTTHLESVREEERARIAREVHDELGQALTALNMDLAWLRKRLPSAAALAPLREKAAAMSALIAETIDSVRKIASALRPSMLDQLGLAAAIEWQAAEFQQRSGIACRLLMDPQDIVLDRQLSIALFRILQEALTNVVRHAAATQVVITLDKTDTEVRLAVEDNGKGITEDVQTAPGSFGILGMRERALALGGALQIGSKDGTGTTVSVWVPL
jgi:PAS domain S-box-containing protein